MVHLKRAYILFLLIHHTQEHLNYEVSLYSYSSLPEPSIHCFKPLNYGYHDVRLNLSQVHIYPEC